MPLRNSSLLVVQFSSGIRNARREMSVLDSEGCVNYVVTRPRNIYPQAICGVGRSRRDDDDSCGTVDRRERVGGNPIDVFEVLK